MTTTEQPTSFQISALPENLFEALYEQSDEQLLAQGIRRRQVPAEDAGMPCRVSLRNVAAGETVLLLNYDHQPVASSPYRSKGPIYVRVGAQQAHLAVNEVPDEMRPRLLSIRAYDADAMLNDSTVVLGAELNETAHRLFEDPNAAYLHVHYAGPGCYGFRIDRA